MGLLDCLIDTKLTEENEPYYIGYSLEGADEWAIVMAQSEADAHQMLKEKLETVWLSSAYSIHTSIKLGRQRKWIFQWCMPRQKPTTE